MEYSWDWINEKNPNSSQLITEISAFEDTLFLISNTAVSYSLNGIDWTLYAPAIRVSPQGMVRFRNQNFFWTANNYLMNKWGRLIHEDVNSVGDDWFAQRVDQVATRIVREYDTISFPYSTERIFEPIEDYFVFSTSDSGSFLVNEDHLWALNKLENEPIVSALGDGNILYLLTQSKVHVLSLANPRFEILQTVPVEMGARLVQIGRSIHLRTSKGYVVLHGCLNEEDEINHRVNQINAIYTFKQATIAWSLTKGLCVLTPTGLSTYWTPSKAVKQVDGLFRNKNNQIYAINRFYNFPSLSQRDDGRISLRLTPPLSINLLGQDLEFVYPYSPNTNDTLKPLESFEHTQNRKDTLQPYFSEDKTIMFPIHLIQAYELQNQEYLFRTGNDVLSWNHDLNHFVRRFRTKGISGMGEILSADTLRYWIGTQDSLMFLDKGFNQVLTLRLRNVRSVTEDSNGLLIGSYGQGLFKYSSKSGLQKIQFDTYSDNNFISEVGFQNGVFFLFSNKGIYFQDSSLIEHNLRKNYPIVLLNAKGVHRFETNGALFNTSLEYPKFRLIATTLGILKWEIPKMKVELQNLKSVETELSDKTEDADSWQLNRRVVFWYDEKAKKWNEATKLEFEKMFRENSMLITYIDAKNDVKQVFLPKKKPTIPLRYALVVLATLLLLIWIFWFQARKKSSLKSKAQSESLQFGWKPMLSNQAPEKINTLVKLIEHDLKGGVGVMNSMLVHVGRDIGGTTQELIEDIGNHAMNLADNISTRFNQLVSDKKDADVQTLSRIMDTVITEVEGYYRLKGQTLNVGDIPEVNVGPSEMFTRCLRILLGNAIKFSPSHSEISITFLIQPKMLTVEITDQGPGLPENWSLSEETIEQRQGSLGEKGMGIALLIATKITTNYQGRIILENGIEKGAIASLKWPIHQESQSKLRN